MVRTARASALKALVWLAAAGVFACGDDAPNPANDADAGAFPMELGKGELSFAPLADGEALPYAHGPQGGQHVWVAFRMQDLDPLRVLVTVTTAIEGRDDLELERRGRVNFEPDEDAPAGTAYVYAGWPAQILGAVDHVGGRAHIAVVLEDRAGRRARASAVIGIAEPD